MKPLDFPQRIHRMFHKRGFVGRDVLAADRVQIVARSTEGDRAHVVRRARLQAQGKLLPGGARSRHLVDHLAPEVARFEQLERLARAGKRTDSRARHHLVSGKRQVIDAKLRDVDHAVTHDLCAVEHEQGARGVGHLGEFPHGVHGAEHVRAAGHRDDLHPPVRQKFREPIEVDIARVGEPGHAEFGAGGKARLLPGNVVRVVLHPAHHDCVSRAKQVLKPAGYHVQAVGRTAREDDAFVLGSPDEAGHRRARLLKGVGGHMGQVVHPAVHVRVARPVVVHDDGKHLVGHLRRRRVVQVHQRVPVHLLAQNREVLPYAFHIHSRHPLRLAFPARPRRLCGPTRRRGAWPGRASRRRARPPAG